MITSLKRVKRDLKQNFPDVNKDEINEQLILDMIDRVANALEQDPDMPRRFVPWYGAHNYDLLYESCGGWIDAYAEKLKLNRDLLSLVSIEQDGTAIDAADTLELPRGDQTTRTIKLINSALWDMSVTNYEGAIEIIGEWGYHDRPSQRWKLSGSELQADIDAVQTTLTVDDADGTGIWGDAPRFSEGQLIKIDDEWLSIRDIAIGTDPNPDTLTVLRGMQGTTAAIHTAAATVSIWNPPMPVLHYATRAVILACKRSAEIMTVKVEPMAEVVYPTWQTMPEYKQLQQFIVEEIYTI